MKKHSFIIISIAVSVFIVVLSIIQLSYIDKIVKMRQTIFYNTINDAMYDALKNISKKYEMSNQQIPIIDMLNDIFIQEISEDKVGLDFPYRSISKENREKYIRQYLQENFSDIKNFQAVNSEIIIAQNKEHSIHTFFKRNTESFSSMIEQSSAVFNLFDAMSNFSTVEPVFDQKDIYFMDSILKITFDAFQLDIKYEFGIYCPYFKKFLLHTNEKNAANMLLDGLGYNYSVNNEFISIPAYFIIYFPEENRYLLKESEAIISTSIIMIFLIYGLFLYTIIRTIENKKVVESRNNFVDNMTHEFKTPIATISLASEALNDEEIMQNKSIRDSYIEIISDENKRLNNMVETILRNAMGYKRKDIKLTIEAADLHDIINKAIREIAVLLKEKDGTITTDFKAEYSIVELDQKQIISVVKNLLDNAIKYTHNKPQIHIKTKNKNDAIIFSVSDNGIGIRKRNQRRIFDRLFRVPTGNIHNVKGYGLGLSYVKTVVKAHKGEISLESKLHKGSTFIICLPINQKKWK